MDRTTSYRDLSDYDGMTAEFTYASHRDPSSSPAEKKAAPPSRADRSSQAGPDLPEDIDRVTSIVSSVFKGIPSKQLRDRDHKFVSQLGNTYGLRIASDSSSLQLRGEITAKVNLYVGQDMQTKMLYHAVTHDPKQGYQDLTSCPPGSKAFAAMMRQKHQKPLSSFSRMSEGEKKTREGGWWKECGAFVRGADLER